MVLEGNTTEEPIISQFISPAIFGDLIIPALFQPCFIFKRFLVLRQPALELCVFSTVLPDGEVD